MTELDGAGIGAYAIDSDVLVAYVVAVDLMTEAAKTLAKEGLVIVGANKGRVRHPASIVFTQNARLVDGLASSLGLSPDARARMKLPTPDTEAARGSGIDSLFA